VSWNQSGLYFMTLLFSAQKFAHVLYHLLLCGTRLR